jgi:hypothetical protein
MHGKVISYKVNILLQAFLYLFYLYCLLRAAAYAFRKLPALAQAVITFGIQIRYKILKDYPEGAGDSARLAACTAHLITLKVAIG